MSCAGGRGSSLIPTMHGRRSSWRLGRRGWPGTRCETPLSRRYSSSNGRTGNSSSWWPICPWRGTVSETAIPTPRDSADPGSAHAINPCPESRA